VEKVLRVILERLKFDSLIERVGVDKSLQRVGIRQQLNQLLPRLAYYLLLLLFARTGADAMGLTAISNAMAALFAYLPNMIAALLLIVVGTSAGGFIGGMVAETAKGAGIDFGPSLGRVVTALIVFIVGIMAITQLKIDTEIVRLVASLVLAAMALAFGLSFGLGSRSVTTNLMAGYYARKILEPGSEVEFAGQKGTVHAITATHVLIASGDELVSVANATFFEQVARQSRRSGS
jgi:hypothetical protein